MAALRCFYASRPADRSECELTATARVGRTPLCSSCLTQRSTLGKGQRVRRLHASDANDVVDPLDWVIEAASELRTAGTNLAAAVHRARQRGHSWATLGQSLGITRQAAQQRFRELDMT